jgi:HD-GYP domain-containing protein (c-di-GMP phosphodiesterase class II)
MAYEPSAREIVTQITMETSTGLGPDAERLQALQAFNTRLVCMTVDDNAYREVVTGVARVIGCDFCALFLHDEVSGQLVLKASVGYEGLPADLSIPCQDGTSIHAQAFAEEYLVHLDGPLANPGVKVLSRELGSNLVLPVISNQGPVGVFDFGNRAAGSFGPQEVGMCSMLVDQMAYSLENIRLVQELQDSRDAVIRGMALLSEMKDSHISGHLNRICEMSRYLAEKLVQRPAFPEVTPNFVQLIERASALHDVGKVGIPDSILLKPGKLTAPEFEVMKSHTILGGEVLEGLMKDFGEYEMISMGAEVARAHHEWWDGSGYPFGLQGRDIPLAARIVAICDVYDALTSRRVYKDAWSQEDTMKVLREGAGKQFDPDLVAIFLARPRDLEKIREKYPD